MSALSISTSSELESLVITAVYSSLITARLSPTTNPPSVNVTSIAPLRDVRPQTVSAMISILSEWEGRCGQAFNKIEAEITNIRVQAAKNREKERDRVARLERSIAGREGDGDPAGSDRGGGRPTGGDSNFLRSKDGMSAGTGVASGGGNIKLGSASGGNSNKREYIADDPEEDDGYWDNGSDGGVDATGYGSRMDIDEAPGASSAGRATAGGTPARQVKRILNKAKKG
jgi:COP9 signalosome complex subunit 7